MSDGGQKASANKQAATAERKPRQRAGATLEAGGVVSAVHALNGQGGNRAFGAALGRGAPLTPEVRAEMETRFGTSFADVQVHNDARAHAHSAIFNAKAFTHGSHIVFSEGRYAPQGYEGKRLLAHELAHVMQQCRGGAPPQRDPGAAHEVAASQAANAVMSGSGAVNVSGATGVGMACEEEEDRSWGASLRRRYRSLKEKIPEEYRDAAVKAVDKVADVAVDAIVPPGVDMVVPDNMGSTLLRAATGRGVSSGSSDGSGESDGDSRSTGEKILDGLRAEGRKKVQRAIGATKGVVTQLTEVADTGMWVGREYRDLKDKAKSLGGEKGSFGNMAVGALVDTATTVTGMGSLDALAGISDGVKELGLVDEKGEASLTAPMTEVANKGVKWAEDTIGGTPEDPLIFSEAELAELEASIGTQVVLAFVGAEEVKVAMNIVGALSGLRGIVETVRNDPNWETSSTFWSNIIGMGLSIVGLKHSMAASKITTIILKFGWIAAAIPPMAQMAADYFNESLTEEERERRMKQNWGQVIRVVKDAILHVAQSQGGKQAPNGKSGPGDDGAPATGNAGAGKSATDNETPPAVGQNQPSAKPTQTNDSPTVTETPTVAGPVVTAPPAQAAPPRTPASSGAPNKAGPPAKSVASEKLDQVLNKLPPEKRGTVSDLRPKQTSSPSDEPSTQAIPRHEEVPQKLAVNQSPVSGGSSDRPLSLVTNDAPMASAGSGGGGQGGGKGGGKGPGGDGPIIGGSSSSGGGGRRSGGGGGGRKGGGPDETPETPKKPTGRKLAVASKDEALEARLRQLGDLDSDPVTRAQTDEALAAIREKARIDPAKAREMVKDLEGILREKNVVLPGQKLDPETQDTLGNARTSDDVRANPDELDAIPKRDNNRYTAKESEEDAVIPQAQLTGDRRVIPEQTPLTRKPDGRVKFGKPNTKPKGSTIPERYVPGTRNKKGTAIEVKNHLIDDDAVAADPSLMELFLGRVGKQAQDRGSKLPARDDQVLIIDIRGQNVDPRARPGIKRDLEVSSNGVLDRKRIFFRTEDGIEE